MSDTRILVVEDDTGIMLALYTSLTKAGYIVDTAKSGASGLRKALAKPVDAIVLDLGLPDMSGLTVCKQLRAEAITVPIIILTGESTVRSKVNLLDAGADDYMTKPFSMDELKARLRSCLRAVTQTVAHKNIQLGALLLNATARALEREGSTIPLRRKEYAILEFLMQHPGVTVTRSTLMQHAWNSNQEAWTNTIDVHIKHLRDKVDRPFSQQLITTVHGVGYKLQVPNNVAEKT